MEREPQPTRTQQLWPLYLILGVGFLIRCWTIGYGTNVDEGDYLMQGRELARGFWPYVDVHLNKPPLVSLIAYPFFLLSDLPFLPLRVLMILVSTSALAAIYLLVREEFGEISALLAAGLLACDPYHAIWSKYLHVSTLATALGLWAAASMLLGLKWQSDGWMKRAGFFTALCLLNKQTGATLLPVLGLLFLLYGRRENFFSSILYFLSGFLPLPLLIGVLLLVKNGFEPFLYDIWYANLAMADVFHYTALSRWAEFRAVSHWNPLAWYGSLLGLAAILFQRKRLGWVLFVWFLLEFGVNIFSLSHVWQHYVMAIMPPAYALAGIGLGWVLSFLSPVRDHPTHWLRAFAPAMALLLTIPFWSRANWSYPNITLQEEQAIAGYLERNCPSPYLLCFVNSAFYIWTDKDIPACVRGDRMVRIPPFMNTAGRGYLTLEDMQKTVALWETLPMDFCAMYGKYYQQIFEEKDPLLEPFRLFLEADFEQVNVLALKPTYYAQMVCFRRKMASVDAPEDQVE